MSQHPHIEEWSAPIQQRISGLERWMAFNAPSCDDDQKHLDEHTPERAYWHYGYLCSLRDVLKLLGESAE